jgi:VWFA-related protein
VSEAAIVSSGVVIPARCYHSDIRAIASVCWAFKGQVMRPRTAIGVMLISALVVTSAADRARAQQAPPPPPPQQQPPPPPPDPQQQPTFRARVDSVSVDVIVLDRQGNPVTDLKPEDFEIRENRKLQTIETFKFIDIEASRGERPMPYRDLTSLSDQRREASRDDTRLVVIFLDDYHVRLGNSLRVREQLAAFVSQLTPHDLVALMYPLTQASALTFSRNHDGTAAALMNFQGRKYDYTPRNAYEERYQLQPPEVLERLRNEITMSALEALCAFLGSLREGRKTVLFVSEGLSSTLPAGIRTKGSILSRPGGVAGAADPNLDDRMSLIGTNEVLRLLREVFAAAGRSNTSVYTLDPRGLATGEAGIEDNMSAGDNRALNEALDSLRTIADQTDGRAIVGRNDPFPGLQQMVRDTGAYYLLGYTSSEAPRDGRFHQIDVRVKRPNVEVRARKGYWASTAEEVERATAPPKPEPVRDVRDAINDLVSGAEPARRRAFGFWIGATRGPGEDAEVIMSWDAPAPDSTTDPGDIVERVTAVVTTMSGEQLFSGAIEKAADPSRAGGRVTFPAPPGRLRVRFTAENAQGRRVDAMDEGFVVPDFRGNAFFITPPAVYTGRTVRALQDLRQESQPVPVTSRAFSRTDRLLLRFDVHAPGGVTPKITMRLLNQQGDAMATLQEPALRGGRYESEIGLGALPPGDYLIEIAASAGSESTRHLMGIRIG